MPTKSTTGTEVALRDDKQLRSTGDKLMAKASSMLVTSQATYQEAGDFLREIASAIKIVEDKFDPELKQLRAATKNLTAVRDEILAKPRNAEQMVKAAMAKFAARMREQREREAEVARAKAQREADDRYRQELADAKAAKDKERLVELKEQGPAPVPVEVKRATPITEGITTRQQWRARVVDMGELIKAAAAGRVPVDLLLPNMPSLNKLAREQKKAMAIPGVEAEAEEIVGASAY